MSPSGKAEHLHLFGGWLAELAQADFSEVAPQLYIPNYARSKQHWPAEAPCQVPRTAKRVNVLDTSRSTFVLSQRV